MPNNKNLIHTNNPDLTSAQYLNSHQMCPKFSAYVNIQITEKYLTTTRAHLKSWRMKFICMEN